MSSAFAPLCTQLRIIYYRALHEAPTAFTVALDNGWFVFGRNLTFYRKTLFPLLPISVYDAEFGLFVPLLATGGLLVNSELHPWVIVRSKHLDDGDCPGLKDCIELLMEARAGARQRRAAQDGLDGGAMANREIVGGSITRYEEVMDEIDTLAGSDSDDGPDVRVIMVFGDNSETEDPDYMGSASEDGSNKGEDGRSEGSFEVMSEGAMETEEEAMFTDEEVTEVDDEGVESDEEVAGTDEEGGITETDEEAEDEGQ